MLEIVIPAEESWDERAEEFVITQKEQKLQLEHSLVSVSKWESRWCKPFLTKTNKSREEMLDYIKCMTITQNVNPDVYKHLSDANVKKIAKYIDAPMTATTITDDKKSRGQRETVTSELIYYWMITLNIPVKFEKWHLNRLLTLIKVCNVKNAPPKKRSMKDTLNSYRALNAARKQQLNTKG